MHELCLERGNSLRPLVELPNGCPSVDTFERVLLLFALRVREQVLHQ